MALTLDLLKAQEGLSGLTDEQLTSIVGLSERDEETVINRKYGEMHGQVDTIVATESAIKRNDGEKSSDYLTRALKQMKAAADEGVTLKEANNTLNAQITKLKEDIAKGAGNETLKQELENLRGDLTSAKKVNTELQNSLDKVTNEYKMKLEGFKMESELGTALSGVALKKELPEATKQALLTLAKQNVMAAKHVYDETAGAFIFQNADGTPMKDKSLNNLTVEAMLKAELEKMGVLDAGRQQGGAGGNPPQGGGSGNSTLDLSGVSTQVEATNLIEKYLMAQGHAKSDRDWHNLYEKLYDENKEAILKLRLR